MATLRILVINPCPWSAARGAASLVASVVLFGGCGMAGGDASASVEEFEQKLVLDLDGTNMPVPLDALDVWLTDSPGRPETFEMHGDGVAIVGTLPSELRVDYEENWNVLVGKSIPISARGGDPQYEKPSALTVPGIGQFRVIGGTITVDSVEPGHNGRTPLTGRIELRVRAVGGEITLNGTFAVRGMTWG